MRILVVEDEKTTALAIRTLLERKLSADVTVAYDCASAREHLSSSTFDLVTLDYQLPDGNGLELLAEITALEDSPPVVMVTGHGDENTAVEAFKLRAAGYVVKDKRMGTLLVEEAEKALELRRATEALVENEERLRLLTDNMVDTITQVDAERRIVFVSPSVKWVFGYEPEELLGTVGTALIHPDDISGMEQTIGDAISRRAPSVSLVARYRRRSGNYFWVESAFRLLYDESGEYKGAIFSTRDITERKQVEELVRAQRDLAMALCGVSDSLSLIKLALTSMLEVTGLDSGGDLRSRPGCRQSRRGTPGRHV